MRADGGPEANEISPIFTGPQGPTERHRTTAPTGLPGPWRALERRLGLRYLMGMDPVALTTLLRDINRVSPPKPELCARLGTIVTAEPNAFNVDGGTNRFDQKPGYGF